ncbi:MAG TPA: hypothetical protein VGB53_12225 [Rubricoccaceae bacterium]|jgi:hypothetical protein
MTRTALLLTVAVVLALATAWIERVGPLRVVSGEGFCGASAAPCEVAVVAGGWPVPYLIDNPQISVPDAPHFVEDDIRWWAFALDVGVFAGAVWAAGRIVRRRGGA